VKIAPISVVRYLNNLIIGPSVDDDSNQSLNVLSEIGLDSGGFADVLFEKYAFFPFLKYCYFIPSTCDLRGKAKHSMLTIYQSFRKLSSVRLFACLDSDLASVRQNSPLLFAACLLVGMQASGIFRGSALHITLYTNVKNHLSMQMLKTPLPLATIHVLLIFGWWNIYQAYPSRFISSWFLSASALSHFMLSFDLSDLAMALFEVDIDARNKCRTWTIACLLHIKYVH
jgi:hypothetical protein